MTNKITGILGGTFDPVHNGHLHIAEHALSHPEIEKILFMPCNTPALKNKPNTNTQQRLDMLHLAIGQRKNMQIEDCEIKRGGISYMSDSLKYLANSNTNPLALVIGVDTFNNINRWHNWQEITKYAHIIIAPRPGHHLSKEAWAKQLLAQSVTDIQDLCTTKSGKVFMLDMPLLPVSSTKIRHDLKYDLPQEGVPDAVQEYIGKNNLYL